ncbi:MAG: RES family NAD+ phosphorylase [Acidobacteriota bacterium]
MADEIETAFEEHFYRTPIDPSDYDYAIMKERDWYRDGDPVADVIGEAAGIMPEPAEDIRTVLAERHFDWELAKMGEENPFDEGAHYSEKGADDAESQAGWLSFEQSLKTQSRYFNRSAQETLTYVFEGIAEHKTGDGHPIIVGAGPGMESTTFYRARVFQSYKRLDDALTRPDKQVGPPPPHAAATGRMNAHGIAVFYGATSPSIALAEVRPLVGSKVVVARFELIRTLRLLDVEALRSVNVEGSIFDRDYIQRLKRAKFLEWLSRRITRPVMPDDEPFEYLATQAIADFLATDANPPLDGILYPSVQVSESGFNVVLFHAAARVEPLKILKGTEVSAVVVDTEDGTDYTVWEETPLEDTSGTSEPQNIPFVPNRLNALRPEDYDPREPALRLDIATVEVHHVNRVKFETECHSVTRLRCKKTPEDQEIGWDGLTLGGKP